MEISIESEEDWDMVVYFDGSRYEQSGGIGVVFMNVIPSGRDQLYRLFRYYPLSIQFPLASTAIFELFLRSHFSGVIYKTCLRGEQETERLVVKGRCVRRPSFRAPARGRPYYTRAW